MRKISAIVMIAVVSALSFVSCQQEIKKDTPESDGVVKMRIHASSSVIDTKTIVSANQEGYYDINWSAGDKIEVLEFVGDNLSGKVESSALSNETSNATFEVTLAEKSGNSFLYETVFPANAYGTGGSEENSFYRLNLLDKQTFTSTSFDGNADLLISKPFPATEQPEELSLEYKRIGSAGRMVLKGITPGEIISKVVFSTEEGNIAGYSKFDPKTAQFLGTYTASKNAIELAPESEMIATGEDVVWFRLYAITLEENFKVVVTTDAATYTKEVDLATANRELAFNDGGLTKFNVAFSAENRKSNSTAQYVLVTDASLLSAGDVIRLGCSEKKKAAGAMGTNPYFASVDATFNNGIMISNDAIDIVLGGSEGAWTLTTSEGKITTSAAKALKLDDGDEQTWTISINDGVAIIAAGLCGSIYYNSFSPRFLNYTSTSMQTIEIYKRDVDDGKQSQSLSFGDDAEFTITLGDEFVAPTLSGNMTEVTYLSSDTNVATVDETSGAVSIVGVGTTTIKATAVANDVYRAANASYTITVKAQGGADDDDDNNGKYVKVTSISDLTDGPYLIICEDENVAFDGGLKTLDAISNTISVSITNGEIAKSDAVDAATFIFNKSKGSFKSASGDYIGNSSDSNALKTDKEELLNTVTISDGVASIKSAGGSYLRYNATSGQTRFRYYKSSTYTAQKAIQLYKYIEN